MKGLLAFLKRFWLCEFGGGGGGQSSTQTIQKADPWIGQQQPLLDMYSMAGQAARATPTTPYAGPINAPIPQIQRDVNQAALTTGAGQVGLAPTLYSSGQEALTRLNAAPSLGDVAAPQLAPADPLANPYLMPAIQASENDLITRFNEEIMPSIGGAAWQQGAYGGSDMTNARLRATRELGSQLADSRAGFLNQAWEQEAGRNLALTGMASSRNIGRDQLETEKLLGAARLTPFLYGTGQQLETGGLNLASGAGQQERSWLQEPIDELMSRYQMSLSAPWQAVNPYANIVQGFNPGSAMNASGTGTMPQPSRASGAIGGALTGGLGTYAAMAAMGVWNPALWPVLIGGALAGGAAGGFL